MSVLFFELHLCKHLCFECLAKRPQVTCLVLRADENADEWYMNLDKLIHHVNSDGRVNMFYSTPELYTDAKHAEGLDWSLKEDDNMPICQEYTNDREGHAYWSGYFSTRAALKRNVVESSGYLQAARQLQLWSALPLRLHLNDRKKRARVFGASHWQPEMLMSDLTPLEMAAGLGTHHDGMTGTCKQHVSDDYTLRLATSFTMAEHVVGSALNKLLGLSTPLAHCRAWNETKCNFTAGLAPTQNFNVIAYNPLALHRTEFLRIPMQHSGNYNIQQRGTAFATVGTVPAPHLGDAQYMESSVYGSVLPYELQIVVSLPPFGLETLQVAPTPRKIQNSQQPARALNGTNVTISNDRYQLMFGPAGTLTHILNKQSGTSLPVEQDFYYYEACAIPGKGAGPYMFRPDANKTLPDGSNIPRVRGDSPVQLSMGKTSAGMEVRQVFADWLTQIIRLPAGDGEAEFEMAIGPIPLDDGFGKEVVARYSTPLKTEGRWLTDSNGRELLQRRRNWRPDYQAATARFTGEPQAANMHPIQTAITLRQDGGAQLTVTPDRSQAGTSLVDGQVELLVHRRLVADDGEGAGEPLNETESYQYIKAGNDAGPTTIVREGRGLMIRARHWLNLDKAGTASIALATRQLAERVYAPVVVAFAPAAATATLAQHKPRSFAGATPLPSAASILTIEPAPFGPSDGKAAFVRLGHKFGVHDSDGSSGSFNASVVTVNLSQLLDRKVIEAEEYSLNGLTPISEMRPRYTWNVRGETHVENRVGPEPKTAPHGPAMTVELRPMEVRAFVLKFA
eukprot:COSAG02_NODE_79_length_40228_cov_18.435762_30_plen_793_part_00